MPLQPEDFERLGIRLEDLTRAERDLFEANQRAQGVGPAGPVPLTPSQQAQLGGASPTLVAGQAQTPFWQSSGKADSAAGVSVSATREILSQSPGLASTIGPAIGSPANAFLSVAQATPGFAGRAQEALFAPISGAFDAVGHASTSLGPRLRARESQFAFKEAELEQQISAGKDLLKASLDPDSRRQAAADIRLRENQLFDVRARHEDELAPDARARSRARSRFENLARVGFFKGPHDDANHKLFDRVLQIYEQQEERVQDLAKYARMRDAQIVSGSPGSHSQRQVR